MVVPLYTWVFSKPFYPMFHGFTTTASIFSNSLLLFIIYTTHSTHISNYRYLLAYFAICDITTSLAHITVQPCVHMTSDDLYFFPRDAGTEICGVSVGSALTVFFIATYFQTFIVLSYHFMYRYKTVTRGLLKSFTNSWRVTHWFLAGAISNVLYFGSFLAAVGYGLRASEEKRKTVPTEILEIYGINLSDARQPLFMFSPGDANIKAMLSLLYCVLLFVLTAVIIIVCIYKTNAVIKGVNHQLSPLLRQMQRQLFRALLIQTAIPCIFSYGPLAVLIPTGCVSGLSIGAFGNVLFMITAIFPAIDAFFVLIFIVKFRNAVIRLFRLPFTSGSGSQSCYMQLVVDALGVFLSLLETILLLAGLVGYVYATVTICANGILHFNFRLLLSVIMFRSVLFALRRLPTIYWRVFIGGEEKVPFQHEYLELANFTTNLLITSLLVLSIERLLNTHVKCFSRRALISGNTVIGALIASNGVLYILRAHLHPVWYTITSLTAAPVVAFVLLLWVYRVNLLRRIDKSAWDLNDKTEASRNMNTVRTFLPPLLVTSLITSTVGLILIAQLFWWHISDSGDSKLNNAYGLVQASDAFLTPLLIIIRHKHFKTMSIKRINSEIELRSAGADQHFNQLQAEWKTCNIA